MSRKLAAVALTLLFALRSEAQTASHQRIGVGGAEDFIFTAGVSVEILDAEFNGSSLEMDPSFSLEFLYKQHFGLSVEAPAVMRLDLNRETLPNVVAALGDPSIAAAYTFRAGDWRLSAELSYTHPWGIWDSREAEAKRVISGSGYRKLGASFSAIRYFDPLVAGISIGADICVDREERFGIGSKPLLLTGGLFATEILNDIVALSAAVSQRLAWPHIVDGVPDEPSLAYSLSGNISLSFDENGRTLSIAVAKLLNETSAPIVFSMGFSIRLFKEEKRNVR
ncbi:MAG: hypothetical protein WC820_10995 [Spirochaetales bacterium]|jgi:hypothetical protein